MKKVRLKYYPLFYPTRWKNQGRGTKKKKKKKGGEKVEEKGKRI